MNLICFSAAVITYGKEYNKQLDYDHDYDYNCLSFAYNISVLVDQILLGLGLVCSQGVQPLLVVLP